MRKMSNNAFHVILMGTLIMLAVALSGYAYLVTEGLEFTIPASTITTNISGKPISTDISPSTFNVPDQLVDQIVTFFNIKS